MTYRADIFGAATTHGLDPNVVSALVEQESAGRFYAYRYEPDFFTRYLAHNPRYKDRDPHEVSASFGLMQVMFSTAVEHGFTGEPWDLFDPRKNLEIGCAILAALFVWARGQYQGLATQEGASVRRTALAAYNGGKGGAHNALPQQYASAVLARWERIRKGGDLRLG